MEIINVKINELKEYEFNAKEHPREQIEQIKNSIKEFGYNDLIAVDENYVVIEGHGRLTALKELGCVEEIEVVVLKHLNEDQKKAYRLIHNKLTMNTDFDFELLEKELAELAEFNFDMSDFGFDENITDEGFGTDFELPDDDKPQTRTITLSLSEEQYTICESVIDYFNDKIEHSFGNHNKRSNSLFEAVYSWAEQNSLL